MRGRIAQLSNAEIGDLHDRFVIVVLRQKGSLSKAITPGPPFEVLKIKVNWKKAVKVSLEKRKPPEGWPKGARNVEEERRVKEVRLRTGRRPRSWQ